MACAFEAVSKSLSSRDPPKVTADIVAKKIIELAQRGVRGPDALAARARQELNLDE